MKDHYESYVSEISIDIIRKLAKCILCPHKVNPSNKGSLAFCYLHSGTWEADCIIIIVSYPTLLAFEPHLGQTASLCFVPHAIQ